MAGERVALLYPGNYDARKNATASNSRFTDLVRSFTEQGMRPEPAVYHDDFCDEVREQLTQVDGVLVWVDPIEGGRDRSVLDAMLRAIADAGVFVSTHPDIILKIGTKEILYRTREMGWGSNTYLYTSMAELQRELPLRLAEGSPRVLKQLRGQSGVGVWKVELLEGVSGYKDSGVAAVPHPETVIRVRHAQRGYSEEQITLGEFYARCQQYFDATGRMIDQAYQQRLPEGMIRCYLVQDKVEGFGHQAINALFPAPPGAPPSEAPRPGPRLYYPPTKPEFQALKERLEQEWLPQLQQLLEIETASLPILWDCDFLLGPKSEDGQDTYVLCEINVSCITPYPESVVPRVVAATQVEIRATRHRQGSKRDGSKRDGAFCFKE